MSTIEITAWDEEKQRFAEVAAKVLENAINAHVSHPSVETVVYNGMRLTKLEFAILQTPAPFTFGSWSGIVQQNIEEWSPEVEAATRSRSTNE